MLLANMAAAHRIYKAEPQRALLRRHPPPKDKMMDDLATLCEGLGLDLDGSSAGKLQVIQAYGTVTYPPILDKKAPIPDSPKFQGNLQGCGAYPAMPCLFFSSLAVVRIGS